MSKVLLCMFLPSMIRKKDKLCINQEKPKKLFCIQYILYHLGYEILFLVSTAEEEDCSAEFQPIVQLQEVETVSGEEAENILGDL